MACNKPLQAYLVRGRGVVAPLLTSTLKWKKPDWWTGDPIPLPCGKCRACRKAYSDMWATRMMKEMLYHDSAIFITLTYSDDNLPRHGSLAPDDVKNFMKRYRRMLNREDAKKGLLKEEYRKIKYFLCGEYGSEKNRPHYHVVLFGHRFDDEKFLKNSKKGGKIYESKKLSKLWKFGWANYGDVTFASCAYVAKYVTKKLTGKLAQAYETGEIDHKTGEVFRRYPEFARMSTKDGGIGYKYYDEYKHTIFDQGYVVIEGFQKAIPRAFKKKYQEQFPELAEEARKKRLQRFKQVGKIKTPEDLERNERWLEQKEKHFNQRNLAQ